jgi:tRNA pseudouridine55 synthase
MTPSFHGLLVLDKPAGMTSRAAVDQALRWFPRGTRVGHTGTLDPLATGVLVLCVGAATRLAEYVQRMQKTYRAGLRLGARSDTDDAEGRIVTVEVDTPPSLDAIRVCLQSFIGEIDQVPPRFSAAKVSGQRAYALARRGEEVDLRSRRVQVYRIDLLDYAFPNVEVEIACGKGTYIRSLARDVGNRLGCGAVLTSLRRTRVGPFTAEQAISLNEDATSAHRRLLPIENAAVQMPRLLLTAEEVSLLRQGRNAKVPPAGGATEPVEAAAFGATDGHLAAIVILQPQTGEVQPVKVFPAMP